MMENPAFTSAKNGDNTSAAKQDVYPCLASVTG